MVRYFRFTVFVLTLAAASSWGGVLVDSLFRSPASSQNLTVSDSLMLAVRASILAKVENISRPSLANSRMRTPDVAAAATGDFAFFWADSSRTTAHVFDKIYRREIKITPSGVDTSLPMVEMCSSVKAPSNYLHSAMGQSRYLVAFVDKNLDTLKAYGDLPLFGRDSIDGAGGVTRAAMCAWKADTFLVVFQRDDGHMFMRRLYFVNNSVTQSLKRDTVTIAVGWPAAWQLSISNPSIAADNAGNFVVRWLEGVIGFPRTSKLLVYDATRSKVDSAEFTSAVDTPGMSNYYDDAPLASYGTGMFGMVSWDNSGILFRSIGLGTPLDTHTTVRLAPGPSSRYPSISSNGKYIAAVWMSDSLTGGTHVKVSGVRDTVKPGYVPFSSTAAMLRFDDGWLTSAKIPGAANPTSSFALNCAVDSLGNVAATWPIDSFVVARMWANRGVRQDSGKWVSSGVKFMDNSQDSIVVLPGSVTWSDQVYVPPSNDSLRTSVRVCWDTTNQSQWNPWTLVTDSLGLVANTKGTFRFLQYRCVLYQGQDTLATPVVKRCSLRWNAKPAVMPLDSLHLNGKRVQGFAFGATDTCFSRSDGVTAFFTMRDADNSDTLYSAVRGYAPLRDSLATMYDSAHRSDSVQCGPITRSDTTITLVLSCRDKGGWNAAPQSFALHTRNSIPQLRVTAATDTNRDGKTDTFAVASAKSCNITETDSIDIAYTPKDTNDPGYRAVVKVNGSREDSAAQTGTAHFVFRGSRARPMGDTVAISLSDPDTTVIRYVYVRTNHAPHILSVTSGAKTLHAGDTLAVAIGVSLSLAVNASDSDVAYWDRLAFRFTYASKDTSQAAAVYTFAPLRADSVMRIKVTDSFGASDSLRLFLKSPWLALDTGANKAYTLAKNFLRDSISLVVGPVKTDSVPIPLVNTGNDTLLLTSLRFSGSASAWLRVAVPLKSGTVVYDSLRTGKIDTLAIAPGQTATILAIVSTGVLSGDGVVHDTLMFFTSDGSHPSDTVPVNLEYNQLPRIASISLDFPANKPYWLAKKTAFAKKAYVFPPGAKIAISFSEPMDTGSAKNAIRAYSVFDSIRSGSPSPILFDRTWKSGDSVLELSPNYSAQSTYFGIKPLPGFFIPGDSIRLFLSSILTDQATTPHGPNNLDVHRNFTKVAGADTMIPLRVDSVKFSIASVSPKSNDTGISSLTPIVLTFSSAPLAGSIDSRTAGNRCLIVHSAYGGAAQVNFKSVTVTDSQATFVPLKQFFYGDTVTCYYRAAWGALDSLGYPVDNSGNGIPVSLFDTSSTQDDKQWTFVIRTIMHTGVSPAPGASGVPARSAIAVMFSDTVPLSTVDTSRRNNATLLVTTKFGGAAQVSFDSIRVFRTTIFFYPSRRLFYGDSALCLFKGLDTRDSARYSIDLSRKQLVSTNDRVQWVFAVHDIRLAAVDPDSNSSSSVVPKITLTFSQPLYSGTFDPDTSGRNRSFGLTSSFTADSLLSFKDIVVSADSMRVVLRPKALFFSNDSIHCFFRGFPTNFQYDTAWHLPPADSSQAFAKRSWYFLTKNIGFYTFPNPYKPGLDPRHCSNPATDPCGIWFTNLHSLRKGVTDVVVKILGTSGNPIYNSQQAGVSIHFTENDPNLKPMWKWDTRNQRGEFVASGLYFYVITDANGSALTKGKLIIVR